MDAIFSDNYIAYAGTTPSRGVTYDEERELLELFNDVGTSSDISKTIQRLCSIYEQKDAIYIYGLYSDDIAWYLALAYIKGHKKDHAVKVLNELIINTSDNDVRAKANNLQESLERL